MNTVFMWRTSTPGITQRYVLIDRYLFRLEHHMHDETPELVYESTWPSAERAREAAIAATARDERGGSTVYPDIVTGKTDMDLAHLVYLARTDNARCVMAIYAIVNTLLRDVRILEVITAFYWALRKEDEIREFLVIDRFLFIAQRRTAKGQLILTFEWADSDYAEGRAIAETQRAEEDGLVLRGSVRVHFTSHSEEDLMRICDDDDGMAAVKMMALAETYGKALT